MSMGNTLERMFENSVINVTPSIVLIKGKSRGTTIAAATLDSIVYVTNAPMLPPNLPVITAAAVAVGHIKHTIAPSRMILTSSFKSKNISIRAMLRHDVI